MSSTPRLPGPVATGLAACLLALLAITFATIWRKRHGGGMDVLTGNAVQAFAAAVFYAAVVLLFEPYRVDWTVEFSLAIGWLVFGVLLGAVTILMLLIRRGSATTTTTSLFFLAPPAAALMAWFAFGETLGTMGVLGLLITTVGVWLVNRRPRPPRG